MNTKTIMLHSALELSSYADIGSAYESSIKYYLHDSEGNEIGEFPSQEDSCIDHAGIRFEERIGPVPKVGDMIRMVEYDHCPSMGRPERRIVSWLNIVP